MIINFITTIFFYECLFLEAIVAFSFSVFVIFFPFLKKYLHLLLSLSGKLCLFFSGCRLIIPDKKYIDMNKPYLIVSNHQSIFDIFTIYAILYPLQYKWIIKKSLFFIPFFGIDIWLAGYICINRKDKRSSLKAIKKAINYVKKGMSIMIFPEGTRSLTDTIQEFKSGSLAIATRTGVDILPVVLKNTLNIVKNFRIDKLHLKTNFNIIRS